MKRFPLPLPLLLIAAFAACASTRQPNIPQPSIGLEQAVGPAELGYPYGSMEVKYNLDVKNNATEPITLIRLDVQSLNPDGGAYTLRRLFYNFHESIPPGGERVVTFWAKATGWGRGMREAEPVTVRGVAYFESSGGPFQKVFISEISQYRE